MAPDLGPHFKRHFHPLTSSPWPVHPGQSWLQGHLSLSPLTCTVSQGLQLCEGAALMIRGQTGQEATAQPGWQPQACSVLRPGHPRHAPAARGPSSTVGACGQGCGSENTWPSLIGQLLARMVVTLSFLGYMFGCGSPGGRAPPEMAWPRAGLAMPTGPLVPPPPPLRGPHLRAGAPDALGLSQFPFPADEPQLLSAVTSES